MELCVTVVGLGLETYVTPILSAARHINRVNRINYGWLGNFRTLIYRLEADDEHFIEARRDILANVSKPGSPVVGMYEHGNVGNLYIFSKSSFKEDK